MFCSSFVENEKSYIDTVPCQQIHVGKTQMFVLDISEEDPNYIKRYQGSEIYIGSRRRCSEYLEKIE